MFGLNTFILRSLPKKNIIILLWANQRSSLQKRTLNECPQLIKLDRKDITIMFNTTNVNNNVEEGEGMNGK
jgi:hypothetical protein